MVARLSELALLFVDALIAHLPYARAHWQSNSAEYCWLLLQFCTDVFGDDKPARMKARRYLLERGVLRYVIHCTVGADSPRQDLTPVDGHSGGTMAAAADGISGDYGPLLELVQQLACSCVPIMLESELEDFGGADNQPLPPTLTDPKLSMNEVRS